MSDRLTPEREAEIAERAETATPGPWEAHPKYGKDFYAYLGGSYLRGVGTLNFGEGEEAEADKALTLNAREDIRGLLAELAAVRAERDQARDTVDFLERNTLPDLHRQIQHHKDGKARWRERAEKAEARVAELEPDVASRRAEIRDSYTALIAQAEQDGDYAGAYDAWRLLQDREEKWKREDATTKPNPTAEEAS